MLLRPPVIKIHAHTKAKALGIPTLGTVARPCPARVRHLAPSNKNKTTPTNQGSRTLQLCSEKESCCVWTRDKQKIFCDSWISIKVVRLIHIANSVALHRL